MKRRLKKIYWLGTMITLIMAIVTIGAMTMLKINDMRDDLHSILLAASAWTLESNDDLQSLADSISGISPSLRVTFLMDEGLVLADSEHAAHSLENHFDRPEFSEALDGSVGESMRFSETLTSLMLYVAKRISPRLILRLGFPVWQISRNLFIYGGFLVTLLVMLYILQQHSLKKFANSMMLQMDDVRMLLEGDLREAKAEFPEFQPAMNEISYLVQRLKDDLHEVELTMNVRHDFVANASHELRSPLTSIMGFVEMLDEGLADTPEEQAICTSTIRSECQRMLAVIEDILRLGRAERQIADGIQPTNVNAIANEIVQALSQRAAQKNISLQIEGEAKIAALEKDIWEILYNLTDNAVRYGREGGFVKIELAENKIAVEDNGIGIDKMHQLRVFEQFYRVDEVRDSSTRGTGLGLSIVRAIAQRYNGDVRLESELGRGSRFEVLFYLPEDEKCD